MPDAPPPSLIPTLARLRPFRGVPGPDIHRLASACRVAQVAQGDTLAHVGEAADSAWLVVSGRLRLEVGAPPQGLGDVWPGEMVGEHGIFGPATHHVTSIVAAADSTVLIVDKAACNSAELRTNPAMAALQRHMLMVTARRLHTLDNSRTRLARPTPSAAASPPAPSTDDATDATDDAAPSLLDRLRALFGGAQ